VSRSWNKPRLCVFAGEDHLALCRVGTRGQVLEKDRVPLAAADSPVATALEGWLLTHATEPGTKLDLVLGLPQVRYLLLPWNPELAQPAFRDSLARALYARQFADEFGQQELRYGPLRYGQPLLVAVIGRPLLTSLTAVATRHALVLETAEPLLATVWNRYRPQLRRLDGSLLIAEASRVLIVRAQAGAIADLQIRPAQGDEITALVQRLAGESACKAFAPQQPALAGSLPAAWLEPVRCDGFNAATDAAYAYALCGVSA
jgi:hypothetical protein